MRLIAADAGIAMGPRPCGLLQRGAPRRWYNVSSDDIQAHAAA